LTPDLTEKCDGRERILDLGNNPRMRVVLDAFRNGSSCPVVSSKLERALIGGLCKALKQFREKGVTLAVLLKSRDCPQTLRQLLRKVQGHDYARLFADAAATCGPTEKECVAGWINALLDNVTDQISHRVAGSEHYPTGKKFRRLSPRSVNSSAPMSNASPRGLPNNPTGNRGRLPKRDRSQSMPRRS
jgi:hypothetical protein